MVCASKMTDSEFAEKVVELYSEGTSGLTNKDCAILNLGEKECSALQQVLATGEKGRVANDERIQLRDAGFSKAFIEGVAGVDGNKAIENRAKWLADKAVAHWYRSDYDLFVRGIMVDELGAIGLDVDEVFLNLSKLSKDESSKMRKSAVKALGRIGSQRTVPVLMTALKDSDKEVRFLAALILGEGEAVPVLKEILRGPNKELHYAAATRLGENGDEEALPVLAEMIRDGDVNRAYGVLQILDKKFGDKRIIPAVTEAFSIDNANVQGKALRILEGIGGEDTIPAFIEAVLVSDVWRNAAHKLGKFGDKGIIALEKAFGGTSSEETKKRIIDAFLAMYDKRAVGFLASIALTDDSESVRFSAVEAIRMIEGTDFAIAALVSLLNDPSKRIRYSAANALGSVGNESALPTLVEMLKEYASDGTCEHTIKELKCVSISSGLSKIGKKAISPLTELLGDPNVVVRKFAADALGGIGGKEATKALLKALDDTNERVRFGAIRGLFYSKNKEDIPVLKKALRDPADHIRSTAAYTLKKIAEKK